MRMSLKTLAGHASPPAVPAARKKGHRLEAFERWTDVLTVALITGLGVAMLIGLVTASGSVTW